MSSFILAIDLKSFYASVECVSRGLDPLDTCLTVADDSRTDKTICLAVSPALKAFGLGGRPRLFELRQKVRNVNRRRGRAGRSTSGRELSAHPDWAVDFYIVPPRMALYKEYSRRVFDIYHRFVAPEDMYIYSVDEVFIDITPYLSSYRLTAHEMAMTMIRTVLAETGITATAGIGPNIFLSKVAMDIMAKKMVPDSDGVRIAELSETSFREQLWGHTPITDFWQVGRGTARRLAQYGMYTMGDVAKCAKENEGLLYRLFGVNAGLLINHAWGWEPATIKMAKSYQPATHSLSNGQVLGRPYTSAQARNVLMEMADSLSLKLIDQHLLTDQITLDVAYDVENISNPEIRATYTGKIQSDHYGRPVPVHSHGTANVEKATSSGHILTSSATELFDRIVNPGLLVRRMTISFNNLIDERSVHETCEGEQLELFTDYEELNRQRAVERMQLERERKCREAILHIKKVFGKNAILTGLNFSEGATQRSRNKQIGGHNA